MLPSGSSRRLSFEEPYVYPWVVNWVDILIVAIVIVAAIRGWYQGAIRQALGWLGFVAGFLIGSTFAPSLSSRVTHAPWRPLLAIGIVIVVAYIGHFVGHILGATIRKSIKMIKLGFVDSGLGVAVGVVAWVFFPWNRLVVPRVPEGSPGIERTLVAYLKSAGKTAQDTSFDGRSDYEGFTLAGIPAGGLFSGAEENKTEDQQKLWGGTANAPFDPNYHKSTDTLDQVDRTCLGIQGGGVAFSVGYYAQDIGGRNGVPVREDRTRHVVTDS